MNNNNFSLWEWIHKLFERTSKPFQLVRSSKKPLISLVLHNTQLPYVLGIKSLLYFYVYCFQSQYCDAS